MLLKNTPRVPKRRLLSRAKAFLRAAVRQRACEKSLLRNLSNVPIIVVLHVLSFLCDVAVGAVWSMMLGPLYTVCVLLGQDVVDLNTAPRSLVCGSQHCDPIDCVVLMYLLHHAHALVPRA